MRLWRVMKNISICLLCLEIEAWVCGSWCLVKGSEATFESCGGR